MNEKQLIAKLQELRQIKPSKDWAVSLKREIIGEQPVKGGVSTIFEVLGQSIFQHKLAYATVTVFLVLVAIFGLFLVIPTSNNNNFETELLAAASASRRNLEAVNQKLEELVKIARAGEVDEAIIEDIAQSIAEASGTITEKIVSNPKALKEIVGAVKQIDLNKNNLKTLGVIVDEDFKLNNILQPIVLNEIESLEKSSLTESQQLELKELKTLYKVGQYTDALEKILLITN